MTTNIAKNKKCNLLFLFLRSSKLAFSLLLPQLKTMALWAALLLLPFAAFATLPPPPAQCAAVTLRAPCGQPTDTAAACASKGCCYGPAGNNATSCFYAANGVPITKVHVIQACHFDAGYADTTSNILSRWWYKFFPQALSLGLELDARGGRERLHFMAQSWIVSLFLDCPPNLPGGLACPTAAQVANFTRAVNSGYIYWHAFPFNGEPELLSPELFRAALDLTHALDARFSLPPKATLSQRDVPGLTRASLPALVSGGVRALTVGVNPWSTPPMVPRAFVWRDAASGVSLPAMWHPYYYGGITFADAVVIPGLAEAVVFDWRGDNAGPPESVTEVVGDFAAIAAEFPGAEVIASTLDAFTALLTPSILAALPVFEDEIGDTCALCLCVYVCVCHVAAQYNPFSSLSSPLPPGLHGAASDPLKSAMSKRAAAARAACLAPGGKCTKGPADPQIANFTRLLLKNAEHTWGKAYSYYKDTKNWTNAQFEAALASPNYARGMLDSWQEQRAYGLDAALGALAGHPLGNDVAAAWADLAPPLNPPSLAGWTPATPGAVQTVGTWQFAFDAASGALSLLVDNAASPPAVWANASNDGSFLALAEYRTYSAADVMAWETAYGVKGPNGEFGRDPSFASANSESLVAQQSLRGLWTRNSSSGGGASFLVSADWGSSSPQLHKLYGAPSSLWIRFDFPGWGGGAINISLELRDKTPTRLPEGLFFRFNASAVGAGWRVDKIGEPVDPFAVVAGGNQRHHGVNEGLTATAAAGARLMVGAPDAAIAAFGEPSIFPYPVDAPADPREGASFFLIGNLWNTNYPFWYPFLKADANLRLRFSLTSAPAS